MTDETSDPQPAGPAAADLALLSPVPGVVVGLTDVPDPVFAEAMVGPGLAVEPDRTPSQDVVSPVAGTVVSVHPHAFVVEVPDGRGVLVHLGIDTVGLAGEGFTVHVAAGQVVAAGERVLTWSPLDVHHRGLATVCPVVALEAAADRLADLPAPGTRVAVGGPLLTWSAEVSA